MISIIKIVEEALSVDFKIAIVVLALIVSFVFYAKDFRIGLIASFIHVSVAYLLLYVLKMDTTVALIVLLIIIVLMALSIYFTALRSENPFVR